MKLSIIIGTKDREESLINLIKNILTQSEIPDEAIIIDDGNLNQQLLHGLFRGFPVEFKYFKKEKKGLTISRNLGAKMSHGDILMFLDDDVLLSNNYIQTIKKIFLSDREKKIGGVGGIIDIRPRSLLQNIFLKIFLLDSKKEGVVLPSSIGTLIRRADFDFVKEVEWLPGCNMSYRKELFNKFSFDENFIRNGWGDDRDFSYRVAKEYKLIIIPYAKVKHLEAKTGRAKSKEFGFIELYHFYRFFQKNMPKEFINIISFYWAMIGICLKNVLKFKLCQLWGNFIAIFYMLYKFIFR